MSTTADQLLTPDQVAEELQVDKRTVLGMFRRGELAHISLGHRTKRVRRSELDQYLAAREVPE